MLRSMLDIALSTTSLAMSVIATSYPASATTWAMPLPIWPAPITPTFLMATVFAPGIGCLDSQQRISIGSRSAAPPHSVPCLLQLGVQLGQRLEQICDQAIVGDLEDRRLAILVDRDDHLGILHTCKVLNGPGNPYGDVELGRHDLAGLAHLQIVRREAGIDGRAAGAHRGAQ